MNNTSTESPEPCSIFNFCLKSLDGNEGPIFQALAIIIFVFVFNYLIKKLLFKLYQKYSAEKKVWKLSFVSSFYKPLSYLVWFVAIIAAFDILTSSIFQKHIPNIDSIFGVAAVLALGWFLIRWNKSLLNYTMEMSRNEEIKWSQSKLDLMSKLGTIATFLITLVLLMDVTGRNMQTLIAFGGISGVALAFASQQFISNFFGGLTIYLTQPFTIGEWISIPDRKIEGYVEEIGWYMTLIRDFDKRPIYVPNSIFNQTVVITPSRMTHERLNMKIQLRYKDISAIKQILNAIHDYLMDHPHTDRKMKIEVYFVNFKPTSLEIKVSSYVSKTADVNFYEYKQDALLQIAEIINKQGAEIATVTNIVEWKNESNPENMISDL
ncbi:MAG: mechanosensitive ion channel family protein [Parachlamydiaceae bacterium]|nr:mechanosensitive ion channel family protein [Parachlamydiaceae bacterium]